VSPKATSALASPSPIDPAQASQQPTEVLAGSIERVTFHNAENGFCVLRIKARGHRDLVTVVGHGRTDRGRS
jgi:exodeoxyribonuclease V alpha subunit